MKKIKRSFVFILFVLFLFATACQKELKEEPKDIQTPVDELLYDQEVIERSDEADRALEQQLEEIPLE